jgi:general secretion pathway protein K
LPLRTRYDAANASETGFILIPVLATLGLLSLIAMTLVKTTVVDVRAAAYQLREAEAEALADGATRLAIRRIVADRTAGRRTGQTGGGGEAAIPVDGRSVACRLPGATAVITAQDAGGLVDLNTAPQALIERLFVGIDLPKDDAARLAAAIADFRDSDDVPLPGGAESAEYRAAGRPFGPKNAPFASVGELDQVLGMTPDLLLRIRGLVTVSSASRGIDLNVAGAQLRGLGLQNEFVVTSGGRAFQLRVAVRTDLGTSFNREATFEPNLRAPAGFAVTDWRRGRADSVLVSQAGSDLGSCRDLARTE